MLLYGRRLYGKIDHVPGRLYVATLFVHAWLIPFFPIQTYIVFEGTESKGLFRATFQGVPIGFDFTSIFLAYLRAVLLLASLGLTPIGLMSLLIVTDPSISRSSLLTIILLGIVGLGCFVVYGFSYSGLQATPARAKELMQLVQQRTEQGGSASAPSRLGTMLVWLLLIGLCLSSGLVMAMLQRR